MSSLKNGREGRGILARPALALTIALSLALLMISAIPAAAQSQAAPYQPLSAKEKNFLLRMAREPMDALLKGRNPRDLTAPGSMRRLNQSQRLVMTLFLDGQFLARAWELRTPGVLQATTVSLAHRIMESPDVGRAPTYDEMSRIRVSMAVIHDLKDIANDKDAHAGQALVATIGMDFAVGLPSDLERGYTPFQLFSKACELSGLRNTAWLGDRATLYSGEVEEFFEN